MSRNSGAMTRHFTPSGGAARSYSAVMKAFAVLALLILLATPAAADEPFEPQVRQLALEGTRSLDAAAHGLKVEVLVGALDPRLKLAPCQRIEPYLPAGTRWWGKTRVGLRCTQGVTPWNVFMPVTVKVHGRALVAAAPLPAGTVLSANDLRLAEVDLAEDGSAALDDPSLALGRTLQRALASGQSLRQSHLKARQWFAVGDTVQVRAGGDGFSVSGEGQALTRGVEGEPARVRTEAGRVLTGMPVAERRMELPL